jgi:hypothetical protein
LIVVLPCLENIILNATLLCHQWGRCKQSHTQQLYTSFTVVPILSGFIVRLELSKHKDPPSSGDVCKQ